MRDSFSEAVRGQLVAQQQRRGLSDVAMGEAVGLHRTQWIRLRLGRSGPGVDLMNGAARAYPEAVLTALHEASERPLLCRCAGCPNAGLATAGVYESGN